jgi:hypothetical protein
VQYGLGGQLDPEVQWWEYATVEARRLTFVSLLDWLSFCFLVCEDLARQEPVARLVRAVGPNLVIALLMDGPQLASRWPGRYATVLADDPGSSVLTLTSIGMANLCRPPGVSPSRTVALWKDAKSGAARQIDLPLGAEGLVLNLTRRQEAEWSADGRSDEGATGYPILGGVHPIFLDRGKRTRKVSEKSKKNMMQEISPLDASILALLAQVPKEMGSDRRALFEETQRNLLHRLGNVAFEIGEAILDDTGRKFSLAAQATAGEMRRWAEANKAR